MVVVGGGPAGMAAARSAADHGIDVALLDEQDRPGGQIYRRVDSSPLRDPGILGVDYAYGSKLTSGFRKARIDYIPGAAVWNIGRDLEISALIDGVSRTVRADRIVLATGAQERPMPFPGWQLPGVMTAGAGQILLKSAGMVPSDPVVLAGSGPLLLLLACQYLRAGVEIQAMLDTTPRGNRAAAARHLNGALRSPSYLVKGARLIEEIRRGRVRVYKEVTGLSAHGDDALGALHFNCRDGRVELETDTAMLHLGVIPQLHLAMAAGCDVRWDAAQLCWRTAIDRWGGSTMPGISIAGDGAGIAGALASELQGRLAALQCLHELGTLSREQRDTGAAPPRKALRPQLAIRPFLDSMYRPSQEFLTPQDETMVCRCEEVSAGEIRDLARLGCSGPNQAKAFSRCGMGPCQGRQCGSTVAALIAEVQGRHTSDVGYYRVRPPIKPVTLGQMGRTGTD
jgi:NADPH-dependent 2,4-dienoyl-CoA reductase/sulfur reductase-like enzyme